MPDVSVFQLGSQQINVKDKTARESAASAVSTAQQAATKADNALQKIEEGADLTRIEVTYHNATETIAITTSDHTVS